MAMVPARGSVEGVDQPDSLYPKLRHVITRGGFRIQWGWRRFLWSYMLRSFHDARLQVELLPEERGATVRCWLLSGPNGAMPICIRVLSLPLIAIWFSLLFPPDLYPFAVLIATSLAWVAACWARYPLKPYWQDACPLLSALDTILDTDAPESPTPLSSSDAGARS